MYYSPPPMCKAPLHLFLCYLENHATLVTSAYAEIEASRNIARKRPA